MVRRERQGSYRDTAPRRFMDVLWRPELRTRRAREAREMRRLGQGIEERVTNLFRNHAAMPNSQYTIAETRAPHGIGFTSRLQYPVVDVITGDVANDITLASYTQGADGRVTYTLYDSFGYSFEQATALQEKNQRRISVTRYRDGSLSVSGGIEDQVKDYRDMTADERLTIRTATNILKY